MKIKFESKYIKIGVMAFLVIAASITLFFIFYRIDRFSGVISTVIGILGPFIYGLVMAYLLCPVYNVTFRNLMKLGLFKNRKANKGIVMAKVVSSLTSIIVMLAIIAGLLWMVLPGLVESVGGIIRMLPEKINSLAKWGIKTIHDMPDKSGPMAGFMEKAMASLQDWAQHSILPKSEYLIQGVSNSILGLVSGLKNFAVGIIICVFFLNSKDIFAAQCRKLIFATMKEEKAFKFMYGARYVNRTFGQFISGKLIDSLIIGIICFIGMSIFNWPYKMLVSVIVGVTNIIPFFGPFIGAIPSALLIFMVDPLTSLYFLIFVLALQQFDGNILGPKILGGSTGLPSFWVMFAILVGGGLFGFVGMIIGIPVFACIYAYTAYSVNKKLEKKQLSTDLGIYKDLGLMIDEKIDAIVAKEREEYLEKKKNSGRNRKRTSVSNDENGEMPDEKKDLINEEMVQELEDEVNKIVHEDESVK